MFSPEMETGLKLKANLEIVIFAVNSCSKIIPTNRFTLAIKLTLTSPGKYTVVVQ